MSAQFIEHGSMPEDLAKGPELSVVPNFPESMVSSYDGGEMQKFDTMTPEERTVVVEWNNTILEATQDKKIINNLLDDAFRQELLTYQEEVKNGETKTIVVGATDGAKEFYTAAVHKTEQIKADEKTAAKARVDDARAQAKAASTPPETRMPNTDATRDEATAEKKVRSVAQGLDTRRANQAAKIVEKQAGYLPNSDGTHDIAIAEKRSRSAAQGLETRRANAEAKAAASVNEPVVDVPKRPREDEPDSYLKSREQSHEAALAMQPDIDTLIEVQAQDKELQTAAQILHEKLGIDIPLNLSTKIESLTTKADLAGEVAIKKYAENLGKTLEKALDRKSDGLTKNILRGEQLNMVEDLRLALGVVKEPDCFDSDTISWTQYFKSDLDKDLILAERIDRKTGRVVEASVLRGVDLITKNKKGETVPSKVLRAEIIKTQTETSYEKPTEPASDSVKNAIGDIGMAAAIMRRRGASGVESSAMERSKKVKRRQPWWQGLFSGSGN